MIVSKRVKRRRKYCDLDLLVILGIVLYYAFIFWLLRQKSTTLVYTYCNVYPFFTHAERTRIFMVFIVNMVFLKGYGKLKITETNEYEECIFVVV